MVTRASITALLLLLPLTVRAAVTLTGADGKTLTLAAPATRIVSLAPDLTELVYAAGAGETLVGASAYSDYPAAAKQLPHIGDAFRVDTERLLALRPDLVLAWQGGT
ncbi:MAG: ABC transporter substrate-binding protein, partial [Gammaproteobacteria bacterium]